MTETEIKFPTKTKYRYLIIIAGLTIFNLAISNWVIDTSGYDSKGNYMSSDPEFLKATFISFLFGFPVMSLLLGLLVALFPYKQLDYNKKYFRASLLSLLTINFIFTIILFLITIMTMLGWYPPKKTHENIKYNSEIVLSNSVNSCT